MDRKSDRRAIVVGIDTFETLWQAKERFRKLAGGKITWAGFLEQAVLFLEAGCLLPAVKAERLNPYVYLANCPDCKTEEYPLRRRRRVIWKVKCSKCGKEYIALG